MAGVGQPSLAENGEGSGAGRTQLENSIDVKKSIDAARRRASVDGSCLGVDGRQSIDGITIPLHDYQRGSDSSEEEAELNNVNLPKSSSRRSFGEGAEGCGQSRQGRMAQLDDGKEGCKNTGNPDGEEWRRVSTEENNLMSHIQGSALQSLPEPRGSGERRSGERRSSERCSRDRLTAGPHAIGDARSGGESRRLSGSSVRTSSESAESTKIRSLSHSTLYLGNLHPYVNDVVLRGIFAGLEGIVELKVIKDRATGLSAGYGFARFADVERASIALEQIKNQTIFGQQIKANWALQKDKEDALGSHHHVFVGDLSPDVRDDALMAAFAHLEGCSDARVMWDHGTGRSKGYGFVSFVDKDQAGRAIEVMDGAYIGMRRVRCGWAKHKTDVAVPSDPNILDQTDPTNTNVYIGNLPGDLSNEDAREEFSKYGTILEIKLHRKGNYGFVRYQTHAEAVDAIVSLNNGQSFGGRKLKCSWGRHPMVPPSGVKAQLIMAAATSGQLSQAGMIQHLSPSYMQNPQVQGYNMLPGGVNLMGIGAPGLAPNRQPSPMYTVSHMGQIDAPPLAGPQISGPPMDSVESTTDSMARMGFYGNRMVMPQNPNAEVDHAMSSGFYRSGNFGQSTASAPYGGYPDAQPPLGGSRQGRAGRDGSKRL